MTVYVDECWPTDGVAFADKSCHLLADSLSELREFAHRIGLKDDWLQRSRSGIPHYDLSPGYRTRAVRAGAKPVSRREGARLYAQ